MTPQEKDFAEILLTGLLMSSMLLAEMQQDYDIECFGYPDPKATNAIRLVSKRNKVEWRIMVEFVGMSAQ